MPNTNSNTLSNRWEIDAEQMKKTPEDLEIYIQMGNDTKFETGSISDAFECNDKTKEAIYVTHIKPDIAQYHALADVPESVSKIFFFQKFKIYLGILLGD